jgi:hypothetical protein
MGFEAHKCIVGMAGPYILLGWMSDAQLSIALVTVCLVLIIMLA